MAIDPAYHTDSAMVGIKREIEKMNGIQEVSYVDTLIKSVNKNFTSIGLVLSGLIALLIITVVLLINNTLRLALFSQRFLIRSMQLVGARKWFIQRPFLMRSVGYGIIAGIVASAGVWTLVDYAHRSIEDLSALENNKKMLILLISLIGIGVLVSVSSSFFAIRKYLKMSLDELY
jgi:cell division transport system permease protein